MIYSISIILSSKPYLRCSVSFLVMLVVSCQPKERSSVATAAVLPSAPLPAGDQILSSNRRFVYVVRYYPPNATIAKLDTLTLTASGKPWSMDSTQTEVEWVFPADTTWTSRPQQRVGAIETKAEFWLHPPRYGAYRILELNPFPHIKLPAVSGNTWEWKVYPPAAPYADPAWASWQGILQVQFRYTLGGLQQLATPFGNLPCHRVQASGTSNLGTTALEAYFHPAYGFVRLNYRNIDASRMQLDLVTVDVQPESAEKALEQVLPKWKGTQPPTHKTVY
jgi:hypothetical protein